MYDDVCDLCLADPALVVFDPRVDLPVVFEHLGQGVELGRAVGTEVVAGVGHVAGAVTDHPGGLPGPETAAALAAKHPP